MSSSISIYFEDTHSFSLTHTHTHTHTHTRTHTHTHQEEEEGEECRSDIWYLASTNQTDAIHALVSSPLSLSRMYNIYIYIFVCVCVCVCIYMYVFIYIYVCVYGYVPGATKEGPYFHSEAVIKKVTSSMPSSLTYIYVMRLCIV